MNTHAASIADPVSSSHHFAGQRLQQLPLGRPIEAEKEFIQTLRELNRTPPEATTLFALLEQTRSAFCFVREAAVRRYLEKAPHLEGEEEAHFQRGIDAAQLMMQSYLLCTLPAGRGEPPRPAASPDSARQAATLLHRCLHYSSMLIFEHYRAKRELPPGIWARHNQLFETACRQGVATLPIDDCIFDDLRSTHCQAAYVTPLLVELARPYGRSPRDLNLIWRWAEAVSLDSIVRPLSPSSPSTAYAVDLTQDRPARPVNLIGEDKETYELVTTPLTGHLCRLLEQLAQGVPPERLGLCEDNIEHSRQLLKELTNIWSPGASQRRHARTGRGSQAKVCTGFHAMHHFILGADPGAACLAQLKRLDNLKSHHHAEDWEIMDQSSTGFRLACPAATSRLSHHQLLAVQPRGETAFRLGRVEWLKREQSGRLLVGITVLPGAPQAVCIRPVPQVKGERTSFVRAFLLPSGSLSPTVPSVVIPSTMSRRDTVLEVLYDRHWHITLDESQLKGRDFEQYGFTVTS